MLLLLIQDPIADAARGILDGHIVLSRELAESGHYPAIDIERSISRVMPKVASAGQVDHARMLKRLFGRYMRSRDLVAMGAYAPGADAELDAALRNWPALSAFLQQRPDEVVDFQATLAAMASIGADAPRGR